MTCKKKKARRFLPSAAPTIPTGGKGYSTRKSIEHLGARSNVRYRTNPIAKTTLKNVKQFH
jgi:hypothetical protein